MRRLRWHWVETMALSVALVGLGACGDDDDGQDQPAAPEEGDLALIDAFSADGLTVTAEFSKPVRADSLGVEHFAVRRADGEAPGAAVSTVAAVDDTTVSVTLDGALAKGPEYQLVADGVLDADGKTAAAAAAVQTIRGPLHVALIWHQHQPVYIDPQGDYLRGPWVRKHGVKDYYDMTAMIGGYPGVHAGVNLTPVLLMQLDEYYLQRIGPAYLEGTDSIDEAAYFAQKPGAATDPSIVVSDPWVDMLLRDTPERAAMTEQQKDWYWRAIWSNFSISEVMSARFPEYQALRAKRDGAPAGEEPAFTVAELRKVKIYFQLAWFDPDFLRGPVTLTDGSVVDLSDLVSEDPATGAFTADVDFGAADAEAIANRLVAEEYEVLRNVVPVHAELAYDAAAKTGQVEVMTTPYYHPILPLIYDTELAKVATPAAPMPSTRFQQPTDADVHVQKAVRLYTDQLGFPPTGMWPAEGSVAEPVVQLFRQNGVRWIATDRGVLERSTPAAQPIYSPYRIDSDETVGDTDASDAIAIVFRDTFLSDKIGFHYQGDTAENNVADFFETLRGHAPAYGTDRLLTVILDGENAWEWYSEDNDAKGFLAGMYEGFEAAQERGELRTVTVSEYLDGNEARGVAAHPLESLPELEPLHAGSWIGGSYATWIGEDEENLAWDYLKQVRDDLAGFEAAGLARPAVGDPVPADGTPERYAYEAWEAMYAAEGSDWFWWYGSDQTAAGGDAPFDQLFLELLKSVYENAAKAGIPGVVVPDFAPILRVCNPPASELETPPAIDGTFDPDNAGDPNVANEWTQAGAGVCMDVDSGTAPLPEDDIAIYYHGLAADAVYLALYFNEDVAAKLGSDYQVRLYFSHKHIVDAAAGTVEQDPSLATTRAGEAITMSAEGAAREVTIDFSGATPAAQLATVADGAWGAPAAETTIEAAVAGRTLELKVPLATLHYQGTAGAIDPLELLLTVVEAGAEIDRAPNLNAITLFPDRTLLVELTFILDATGDELALDAVKAIANPPPPTGTGTAFIVGNQPEIGDWTPNSIAMADDGATHGDEVAGDNLWTFRMLAAPMTDVQYKYTIGSQGEGWGPTEEYPLTNRGLRVTDRNGDRKMVIRDVFADRPDPSGSMAAMSELLND